MLSLECSLRPCAETTCSNACVVIMTSVHMTCKRSQNLVRMEGVLITPKKVSDCKDEDLDEIMEELESIAFQIRSDIDQISITYLVADLGRIYSKKNFNPYMSLLCG